MDVPSIITIHDTIWLYPTRYTVKKVRFGKRKFMELYYRYVPEFAIRKAQGIITVSQAAKENIVNYLRVPEERIFVIHEAANEMFHPIKDQELTQLVVRKYGLKNNYILGIGSADPRKNLKVLLEAYALLPEFVRDMCHLAIVWNHNLLSSELLSEAQTLGILEQVLFIEDVNDQDLVALYNGAAVFVFPSLEEGFGLPPLEAMACGTPVLAADNSSIPEIVGDAALKFHAKDTAKLAELISDVITNRELRLDLKRRGIERAAGFSWKNCGLETVDVYQKLAGRS
jgi:glycosyltransferase involved in cell wall biosynthesis